MLILDAASPAVSNLVGERQPGGGLVSDGRAGFLMFGPYARLDAGQYRVTVHGTMQTHAGNVATFDVVYDHATKTAQTQQVITAEDSSKPVLTAIEFSLEHADDNHRLHGGPATLTGIARVVATGENGGFAT